MTARSWLLALGVALFACIPGCIITVTSTPQAAYNRCTSSCESGTTCTNANLTVSTTATVGESFCTTSCVISADCPVSAHGASCVTTLVGGQTISQCYDTCSTTADCPSGFTCGGPPGMQTVCVPGTATASCGGSGQPCCSGSTCSGGLTCGAGGICGTVAACGASGQACCAGNTCSGGLTCGAGGICGVVAACGANGQACCAGNACNGGLACATTTSGGAPTCIPCGTIGGPCCAGDTCSDAGAACASDGLCGLAPYSGCAAASVGAACLAGLSTAGSAVQTTCTRPMIANAGPDGFCTASCAASAAECPQWVGADRTYSYNCYILQGTTAGQCYIDCPAGESCPANTVCTMTASATGAQVRLCMPPPT